MLIETQWSDQWISENYPNAMYLVETVTGEVMVALGYDENGNEAW